MFSDVPLTRDLVLVGGGHAHALVLRAWGMKPVPGARLTVINPGPTAPYTGMLPGHIAGHYSRDALEIDLVRLCRFAGARLILDSAVNIDRARQEVVLSERPPVGYDVASIDVGITARMNLPGFAAHGIPAKPLDAYASRWRVFLAQAARGDVAPDVAVIGGGVAGCELAMAMAHAMKATGVRSRVTLIEAGPDIRGMARRAREKVKAAMVGLGITLRVGATVLEVTPTHVSLRAGPPVPAALCVGAAGAFPHDWIAQTDLPQQDGFIEVGRDFGVTGDKCLFAVGDCAVMPAAPRPKAGVFAVRAAPVLHHNLRVALTGGARRQWRPQKNYLKLISLGETSALAEKFGLTLAGPYLWRWKDQIDRNFMDRLSALPPMKAPRAPAGAARGVSDMLSGTPLCGGCGAKVGQDVLLNALGGAGNEHADVVKGAGDDAAILHRPGGDFQVISTDHLRAMITDPYLMARIAAVHALGDVWAMGAKPQVALASLILPQMTERLQGRALSEVMAALEGVLSEAGAQLVGGHTTMGAEWTIGLTVTGTRKAPPITVAGAQEGDRLILTRPLGTGILLAADMTGQAPGRDLSAALEQMARLQNREAGVLASVAHAMTDVTGFGLAGHLKMMCAASGLSALLFQDALPVYDGVRALSDAGHASSLAPANRAATVAQGVDDPLLYDPQTAGGLLASVPQDQVDGVKQALTAVGLNCHIIGEMREGPAQITLRQSA